MEIEVWKFLEDNWQNIIITLAAGLIFYFLTNYALKKYFASAENERLKQAKDSLLDILEARIINKQHINLDKINNLLTAIDRDYSVYLSDIVSPFSLLEDLELRFEKSHHLDPTQKDEYCSQIQNQIQNIRTTEEALNFPRRYSEILENLETDITSENTDNALKNLELLKRKINDREEYIYKRPNSTKLEKISTLIASIIFIYTLFILSNIFDSSIIYMIFKYIIFLAFTVVLAAIIAAFVFGMGKKK
ncbi:MAG: type IV pilin N-terminal domain-containing protein [Spirochaetes bacterium]|nr:type IV pilin N-terminal domain-containing protein [Spirochaetota bacterium]